MRASTAREVLLVAPLPEFVHETLVPSVRISWDAPLPLTETQWARCRSPRGQPVCSCGRFALRWSDA